MEKTKVFKDDLGRKITVHYFNNSAQYEYEGKAVKHVVTRAKLEMKIMKEKWR